MIIIVQIALRRMENMGDEKIHKSIQYSVWCYSCDNLLGYSEFDNKADAEAFYRCQGFRKTTRVQKTAIARWKWITRERGVYAIIPSYALQENSTRENARVYHHLD